jgi:Domain of unknown function (DUF4258)
MYNRVLQRIRDRIRRRQYIVTYHARKEMQDDDLTIYDVERGLLTGNICERQHDPVTGESKYRLQGVTIDEQGIEIIVKISPTGKLVIITVYTIDAEEDVNGM